MGDLRNLLGNSVGQRLFFSERDSDVSIHVEWEGRKWHFPGHKLVLSTVSEVFRTMFDTDMVEKKSGVLHIRDSNPYAFKQFLRYLYMGIVDFNGWQDAVDVLKIAHKYGVQTLTNLCEGYLITTIVFSNSCVLHDLARTYSLKMLKAQTSGFILDGAFVICSTDGFFNLKAKSLEEFLGSTVFNMENEGCILTCLREWAVCECSRRCMTLSRSNVLSVMEPFFKYIRWDLIAEVNRTFVPRYLSEKYKDPELGLRKALYVPASLQYHINLVKFVVELGSYHQYKDMVERNTDPNFVKFSVDNHAFMAGFRIVGLFRLNSYLQPGLSCLTLSREDKIMLQFNLNSLTWTKGSSDGKDIWREIIAYLPYPIRMDPFSTYSFSLKCGSRSKHLSSVRWPKTRLDSEVISTNLGPIAFRAFGTSYGITQLFVLPAPPYKNICNGND